MSETQAPAAPARDGPEGIGGWLILPVIGLVLTPLRGLLQLGDYSGLGEMFPLLSGGQKTFLVAEIGLNLVLVIIAPVVLLILLFNRKLTFPRLYAIWGIVSLVFLIGDLIVAKAVFPEAFGEGGVELLDDDTVREIIRAFVLVLIWVPYMLLSRRARNTFTQ